MTSRTPVSKKGDIFRISDNKTLDMMPLQLGRPDPSKLDFTLVTTQGAHRRYVYPDTAAIDWYDAESVRIINKWFAQILRRTKLRSIEPRSPWIAAEEATLYHLLSVHLATVTYRKEIDWEALTEEFNLIHDGHWQAAEENMAVTETTTKSGVKRSQGGKLGRMLKKGSKGRIGRARDSSAVKAQAVKFARTRMLLTGAPRPSKGSKKRGGNSATRAPVLHEMSEENYNEVDENDEVMEDDVMGDDTYEEDSEMSL